MKIAALLFLSIGLALSTPSQGQNISGSYSVLTDPMAMMHTVAPRNGDETMATDFCNASQATGGTDATACLQLAVNALCNRSSSGGGRLYIPAGTYNVTGTVNIPCSGVELIGGGIGDRDMPSARGTLINAQTGSDPNAPVFNTTATSRTGFAYGFDVKDMSIYNSNSSRSGAFINIVSFEDVVIDNVYFFAPCTAIKVAGGNGIYVTNSRSSGSAPNCDVVSLVGTSAAGHTLDVVSFKNFQVSAGPGSNCYRITDRVQTIWWANTICETAGRAILSTCATSVGSAANCPGFFTMSDFESEGSGSGYNMLDITDLVGGFKMSTSWIRGTDLVNYANNIIKITPQNFPSAGNLMVNVIGSWLKGAASSCIQVSSQMFSISSSQVYGCNHNNVGGVAVNLTGTQATISSNQFCGDDWLGNVNNIMGGVLINSASDYVALTGNIFSGNVGGHTNGCNVAYINNGGTHFSATGNVGP